MVNRRDANLPILCKLTTKVAIFHEFSPKVMIKNN